MDFLQTTEDGWRFYLFTGWSIPILFEKLFATKGNQSEGCSSGGGNLGNLVVIVITFYSRTLVAGDEQTILALSVNYSVHEGKHFLFQL